MSDEEALIVTVLRHYFPDWDPPRDRGREWQKALCPFHAESNPSASLSFEHDGFKCHACDVKGDALAIIMREEGIGYRQALEYAEELSPGSGSRVQRQPARKSGRRAFGESRTPGTERKGDSRQVPPGIRRRPTPWT